MKLRELRIATVFGDKLLYIANTDAKRLLCPYHNFLPCSVNCAVFHEDDTEGLVQGMQKGQTAFCCYYRPGQGFVFLGLNATEEEPKEPSSK